MQSKGIQHSHFFLWHSILIDHFKKWKSLKDVKCCLSKVYTSTVTWAYCKWNKHYVRRFVECPHMTFCHLFINKNAGSWLVFPGEITHMYVRVSPDMIWSNVRFTSAALSSKSYCQVLHENKAHISTQPNVCIFTPLTLSFLLNTGVWIWADIFWNVKGYRFPFVPPAMFVK